MSRRIQVTVDDHMNELIQQQAEAMGLSVSSYTRYVLKHHFEKDLQKSHFLDEAIASDSEKLTLTQFKKQINDLK